MEALDQQEGVNMTAVLITFLVCVVVLLLAEHLHTRPITFVIHHKYEQILPPAKEPTAEEKKFLEEQGQVVDGLNEVIKFTQDFLGGEPYAESKRKAE